MRGEAGIRVLLASLSLASSGAVLADLEAAQRAARQMEQLAGDGDYQGAEQALSTVDCAGDTGCRTVVDFSYGWLAEARSVAEPGNAAGQLETAQAYYGRAHAASPGNVQILNNLALVSRRLGDTPAAVAAAEKALALDPASAYERYLFLGDTQAAAGNTDAAITAWRAASKANAADGLAHQRLLETWRKLGAYKELVTHSATLQSGHPDLAAAGYRYAINLAYVPEPALAEQALVHWTAVCSDLGVLTPSTLAGLPPVAHWTSAALAELVPLVVAPGNANDLSWWTAAPERQDAVARALRAQAARLRAAAESAADDNDLRQQYLHTAIDYLRTAVKVAPPFDAYLFGDLARLSNARLDAAADLVALHYAIKAGGEPDPLVAESTRELEQMTEILFSGKAGAYAAGQLDAIQRYHTVLGMIYYTTGRLTSTWADNATFQLEHALSVAAKIAGADASRYRPLPELQGMLADVYQREGREQDSARLSLAAAMGYLETDNLAAAGKSLGSATAKGADAAQASAVATVLEGRRAIESRGVDVLAAGGQGGELVLAKELSWVADPASLGLPSRFVDGQRFKALADMGALLEASGNRDTARDINAHALDAYGEKRTLLSPTDLRRLRSIDSSITRMPAGTTPPVGDNAGADAGSSSGYEKAWTVQTAAGQTATTVNPGALDASREIVQKAPTRRHLQSQRQDQ